MTVVRWVGDREEQKGIDRYHGVLSMDVRDFLERATPAAKTACLNRYGEHLARLFAQEGFFLVHFQDPRLTERNQAALKTLSDQLGRRVI